MDSTSNFTTSKRRRLEVRHKGFSRISLRRLHKAYHRDLHHHQASSLCLKDTRSRCREWHHQVLVLPLAHPRQDLEDPRCRRASSRWALQDIRHKACLARDIRVRLLLQQGLRQGGRRIVDVEDGFLIIGARIGIEPLVNTSV